MYVKSDMADNGRAEVVGADAATFAVPDAPIASATLTYGYAKDKNHVYYRIPIDGGVRIIKGADPATFFVVLNSNDFAAEDQNHKYIADWIICEDPIKATCTLWDGPGDQYGHWFAN